MGKRNGLVSQFMPYPPPGQGGDVQKYRDRTPNEVISDGAMAIVQATNLNTVTQLAMGSVRQCEIKRLEVTDDYPSVEPAVTGLLYNHVRLMAVIQGSVVNNDKRVI